MNLENPKKFKALVNQAQQVANEVFRPISRKYDLAEHDYPKELDMLAAIMDGMNDGDINGGAGAARLSKKKSGDDNGVRNGANMSTVLGLTELCWGDTGLALSLPRQGLGNAAIAAVANDEQLKRFQNSWAAMAITEPGAGSDSANIRTTAQKDGDHYILNGEKIFVTCGERADAVVVWATLDKSLGKAAIKSFVVEKGTPGMDVTRLEHKLGIKASDTAAITFTDCRVPAENLLGNPEVDVKKGFGGVMETFDNTRPVVASMAVGLARAALERTKELLKEAVAQDYTTPINNVSHVEAELYRMEANWESARLLTLKAAWMADNGQPNSLEASVSKAKAGRTCNAITMKCVELCSSLGYSEKELLEKWARDSKILDIFEGTQQIQQLIIARRLLNKSSAELK
ncbi:MAG: acyl-CoA dehydrogenase family protein [Pseudomonadales bacterium]|uniref:Acyl-CoA dehydrogenase n=1 Tax=Oleiphilus messinensis TaxID=141451 RepID=A0A1Y0IEZ0_9GAMM|nr:acyl-CoA dehydrogenase family protein [Oleiphilus messinensis]ARU59107.1 acyl-CoA dehydrogenase [Oleiphilus messinensis]MCG8610411.1 acyl-CoA dehydrogenase family protein [Pseudomonadales bacterium]